MKCANCGSEISDGSRFCPVCGARTEKIEENGAMRNMDAADTASAEVNSSAEPRTEAGVSGMDSKAQGTAAGTSGKKNRTVAIAAAIAVVVLAAVIVIAVSGSGTTVRLNSYITFIEYGYEGYGRVSASFDYDAFEDDYYGKIRLNSKDSEVKELLDEAAEWGIDTDLIALSLFEEECINYWIDANGGFSNGDTATLVWDDATEDVDRYFKNLKVKYNDVTYTLSELGEVGSIDFFDGLKVTFSGTNTLGTIDISYAESDINDYLYKCLTIDKSSGLSNGDMITLSLDRDSNDFGSYCAQNYGVVPLESSRTYTVEGLKDIEKADIFADVEVVFSGLAPLGEASVMVNTSDSMITGLSFSLDVSSGLSNGDVVTVTAAYNSWNSDKDLDTYLLEEYGVEAETASKEYTVSGIGGYVTELSAIPDDMMEKMKSQGEDVFKAYVANNWVSEASVQSIKHIGSYLLVTKDWSASNRDYNKCYLVYEIDSVLAGQHVVIYYYIMFSNILILDDGVCSVDLSKYSTPSDSFNAYIESDGTVRSGNYTYKGYETIDALFSNCVTRNIEYYTYESTVGEASDGN